MSTASIDAPGLARGLIGMAHHSSIRDYEEHCKYLGLLIANWASTESMLLIILGHLLQVDQQRAQLVYREFIATGPKFNLMRRLLSAYVGDGPERKELLRLLADAQRYVKIRNKFAHATWGATDGDEYLTLFQDTAPDNTNLVMHRPEQISPSDIKEQAENIAALNHRLALFLTRSMPFLAVMPRQPT